MQVFKQHLPPLIKLALPVVGAQLGMMAMGVVDTAMVGRLSVEALAASALGGACLFSLLWISMGFIQGIDPLVTQAHGAKRDDHAQLALQRGVVVAAIICLPLVLGLAQTENILLVLHQSPHLAKMAGEYVDAQLWSLPLFLLFMVFRQYLQGREIVRPMFWIVVIANLVNAFGNYLLIYGNWGAPQLGLNGAGIASAITRAFMFATLLIWVYRQRQVAFAWLPNYRAVYKLAEFGRIFQVGTPVAAQIGLEVLAFNGCVLIAGMLGETVLGAHSIALNIASLAFMLPLGISQATVTRVGNLIGAHQFQEANRAAWVAIASGGFVMLGSAGLFVLFNQQIPRFYTNVNEVILITASVLPIAAAFQIFDGIQVVCSGILRGMGRPLPSTVANFLAFWVIGLPIGYWTSIELGYGIKALWWSLVLGLSIVAVLLMVWIAFRGPDKHAKLYE